MGAGKEGSEGGSCSSWQAPVMVHLSPRFIFCFPSPSLPSPSWHLCQAHCQTRWIQKPKRNHSQEFNAQSPQGLSPSFCLCLVLCADPAAAQRPNCGQRRLVSPLGPPRLGCSVPTLNYFQFEGIAPSSAPSLPVALGKGVELTLNGLSLRKDTLCTILSSLI